MQRVGHECQVCRGERKSDLRDRLPAFEPVRGHLAKRLHVHQVEADLDDVGRRRATVREQVQLVRLLHGPRRHGGKRLLGGAEAVAERPELPARDDLAHADGTSGGVTTRSRASVPDWRPPALSTGRPREATVALVAPASLSVIASLLHVPPASCTAGRPSVHLAFARLYRPFWVRDPRGSAEDAIYLHCPDRALGRERAAPRPCPLQLGRRDAVEWPALDAVEHEALDRDHPRTLVPE